MAGDERVRVCGACKHNVYDTSKMTSREIQDLTARDANACLKIFRRQDGTILTEDCPFGLRTIRRGARKISKIAASLWALAISFTSVSAQSGNVTNADGTPAQASSKNQTKTKKTKPTKLKTKEAAKSDLTESVVGSTTSPKDTVASDLLTKARSNIAAKNYTEAEQNFKDATAALSKSHHDIAFAKLIWSEYSAFLVSQNRKDETAVITKELSLLDERQRLETPREMSGAPVEPGVLDERHYTSGRSERRQKTAPTLPDGAPVPDNE